MQIDERMEWLEADGLGGFASGTAAGLRTRRYHALLLPATTPPTGRTTLVNGVEAWLDTPAGSFALSSQRYAPGVVYPDGVSRIASFRHEPWPTWELEVPGGIRIVQEILVEHGVGATLVVWTVKSGTTPVALRVRPFLSGRDYHSMHRENGAFRFDATCAEASVTFRPYDGVPPVTVWSDGDYRQEPDWYRNFLYEAERERGLDDTEDLASPGVFSWPLTAPGEQAVMILSAREASRPAPSRETVRLEAARIYFAERRRRMAFDTPLDRAADAYLVTRGRGRTIVAGYPWFTDWGRDTFIAVRGLYLASGRVTEATEVLVEWAGAVSEGMLPNRFADSGGVPEFNSVDASLWYVVAVGELLARQGSVSAVDRTALERAVEQIVDGYARGTRHGIHADADGLLAAGVPGQQLTWMDARIGDRVITPRIGKPVEIQALWLNALTVASRIDARWRAPLERGLQSFPDRFWREDGGGLADVVDVDHVPGTTDDTVRPNQILAVGGLPLALMDGERAARIVETVERQLLTPTGLRSLSPDSAGYAPRYEGGPVERDSVYHQGTVWPWLLGPFVDAWVRVRGNTAAARRDARARFVEPLLRHLEDAGLGHVSEITDAEAPFTPRGCPFQAWSLGELLRVDRQILGHRRAPKEARPANRAVRR